MPGGRRGLVAPQNTFLDSLIKKAAAQAGDIGNIFMHITMMVVYNILNIYKLMRAKTLRYHVELNKLNIFGQKKSITVKTLH